MNHLKLNTTEQVSATTTVRDNRLTHADSNSSYIIKSETKKPDDPNFFENHS
jgi:hypothetical protein